MRKLLLFALALPLNLPAAVSQGQFSYLTDTELSALYDYFTKEWTAAKGIEEEKKIPVYFKPH